MQKIWFITGANRGIGAAIARAALGAGDKVVATGRQLESLHAQYAGYGEQVLCLSLDVTRELDSLSAVEIAVAHFGRIDVFVNNAGYGQLGAFEEVSPQDIEHQFATNVFGLMHATRAVLPVMRKQRAGHIINLSSIGGVLGFDDASVYCATKFAVEGFSESLAQEVAPFGINLTIVEPGFFRTDFLDASSVRYGSRTVADYAATSAMTKTTYDGYNHQQPGDPTRLGLALVRLAAMAQPPLHFVAGSDAVGMTRATFERRRHELELHVEMSEATDVGS